MANSNKGTAILAVVVTLVVAGTGGYMLGARLSQPEAQVVASVNSDKITKTALYDRMVKEAGPSIVDQMITEKLVDQAAAKANVTVSPSQVDAKINQYKTQFGGDAGFEQALASSGMTLDQLKSQLMTQLKVMAILGKDVKTDDATLQKYLDAHLEQFDKREITARHILLTTEEEAKAVKAQLDAGADFAKLAKEKSIEPAAKTSGGDLGSFGRDAQMDPDFLQGAFALQKGQISNPVKSQFGWHVIQVTDVKGAAPTLVLVKDQVKDAVVSEAVSEKYQTWITGLKAEAKITNTLEKK